MTADSIVAVDKLIRRTTAGASQSRDNWIWMLINTVVSAHDADEVTMFAEATASNTTDHSIAKLKPMFAIHIHYLCLIRPH